MPTALSLEDVHERLVTGLTSINPTLKIVTELKWEDEIAIDHDVKSSMPDHQIALYYNKSNQDYEQRLSHYIKEINNLLIEYAQRQIVLKPVSMVKTSPNEFNYYFNMYSR